MKEQIYTIPVSEAFEARSGKCPLCLLFINHGSGTDQHFRKCRPDLSYRFLRRFCSKCDLCHRKSASAKCFCKRQCILDIINLYDRNQLQLFNFIKNFSVHFFLLYNTGCLQFPAGQPLLHCALRYISK